MRQNDVIGPTTILPPRRAACTRDLSQEDVVTTRTSCTLFCQCQGSCSSVTVYCVNRKAYWIQKSLQSHPRRKRTANLAGCALVVLPASSIHAHLSMVQSSLCPFEPMSPTLPLSGLAEPHLAVKKASVTLPRLPHNYKATFGKYCLSCFRR